MQGVEVGPIAVSPTEISTTEVSPSEGRCSGVIGLGNPLRGDDGVGVLLADQVGGRSVQQLTPELAASLAPLEVVLFIDAWLAPAGARPQLQRLSPVSLAREAASGVSHGLTPAELLAISQALYGHAPEAWVLLVPAHVFAHGSAFSAELQAALPVARQLLQDWLARPAGHA